MPRRRPRSGLVYGSVCSGIEAASVAWGPLGWRPEFFAEIEPFPSAVLAARFPGVPNLGDFTKIGVDDVEAIDVLVAGTPCQDFSIAGRRLGIRAPRGNLALEFLALATRLRPRWIVFENVPGLLSNWSGAQDGPNEAGAEWEGEENSDFAAFLGAVRECGYLGCWRVLDAQYAGLAQRRERVFFVGYLGDWRPPAAVLFESASLLGYHPPRREAGEGVAPTISARTKSGGGLGTDFDCYTLNCTEIHAVAFGGNNTRGPIDVATARNAHGGPHGRCDFESETFIAFGSKDSGVDAENDLSPTLRAGGHDRSHANSGVPPAVVNKWAVRRLTPKECSRLQGFPDDYLELIYADADEAHAAQILHVVWREASTKITEEQEWRTGIAAALLAPEVLLAGVYGGWISWEMAARCAASRGTLPGEKYNTEAFVQSLRVNAQFGYSSYRRESFEQCARELGSSLSELPLESAHIRAFLHSSRLWKKAQEEWPLRYAFATPKERTRLSKLNPDGPRYRALGNSMAVPLVRWIGARIAQVDGMINGRASGYVLGRSQG